jgi:hypothetical protein
LLSALVNLGKNGTRKKGTGKNDLGGKNGTMGI